MQTLNLEKYRYLRNNYQKKENIEKKLLEQDVDQPNSVTQNSQLNKESDSRKGGGSGFVLQY